MDVQLLSHFIGTLVCTLFTPIWVLEMGGSDMLNSHSITSRDEFSWVWNLVNYLDPCEWINSSSNSSWSKHLEGGDWMLCKINITKGMDIN
jgi:hypothetical protein